MRILLISCHFVSFLRPSTVQVFSVNSGLFYVLCLVGSRLCVTIMFIGYNIHIMCAPEGNSEFYFPESLNVSRDEVEALLYSKEKKKLLR